MCVCFFLVFLIVFCSDSSKCVFCLFVFDFVLSCAFSESFVVVIVLFFVCLFFTVCALFEKKFFLVYSISLI